MLTPEGFDLGLKDSRNTSRMTLIDGLRRLVYYRFKLNLSLSSRNRCSQSDLGTAVKSY